MTAAFSSAKPMFPWEVNLDITERRPTAPPSVKRHLTNKEPTTVKTVHFCFEDTLKTHCFVTQRQMHHSSRCVFRYLKNMFKFLRVWLYSFLPPPLPPPRPELSTSGATCGLRQTVIPNFFCSVFHGSLSICTYILLFYLHIIWYFTRFYVMQWFICYYFHVCMYVCMYSDTVGGECGRCWWWGSDEGAENDEEMKPTLMESVRIDRWVLQPVSAGERKNVKVSRCLSNTQCHFVIDVQ